MVRTQIYLPKALKDKLQKIAYEKGISVSEVVRQILNAKVYSDQNINIVNDAKAKYTVGSSDIYKEIRRIAEEHKNENTPTDLSKNLDKYLYTNK